jgi:hypothetical protein
MRLGPTQCHDAKDTSVASIHGLSSCRYTQRTDCRSGCTATTTQGHMFNICVPDIDDTAPHSEAANPAYTVHVNSKPAREEEL